MVKNFDNLYDTDLYNLKYHLLSNMVNDIRKFGTLFVYDSSSYEHFNVHMKKALRTTLLKRKTRIMEVLSVTERNYERALSSGKQKINETLRRKDK